MSFGRKGLAPGSGGGAAPPAMRLRPGGVPVRPAAAPAVADPYAAQREAFLAAERARLATQRHEDAGAAFAPSRSPRPASRGHRMFGDPAERSLILAYVFWNFCSPLGLHRIYCGDRSGGLMQLGLFWGGMAMLLAAPPVGVLLIGAWGLWMLADLFLMPGLMRRFKASQRDDEAAVFA